LCVHTYLLDTHVLLWASADPSRLGPSTARLLTDESVSLAVSSISVAEIAIKRAIGRLVMSAPIAALLEPLGATALPLTLAHAEAVERLPMVHRNPFDRLLAAQAAVEQAVLVTADERLLAYPIDVLDARR